MFLSVEQVELLSLTSLSDWISLSICLDRGAALAFTLVSTSIELNLQSSNFDCNFSPSLAVSLECWTSPTPTSCLVGALFSSDMLVCCLMT